MNIKLTKKIHKYIDYSNNNIFDIDNIDNNTYNNQTYTNGFTKINNKPRNNNNYYIKKLVKSNTIKNLSLIDGPQNLTAEKTTEQFATMKEKFIIEAIPIFNQAIPIPKGRVEKNIKNNIRKSNEKQNIYFKKKKVSSFLNNSDNLNKKNLNSTIDEINISLKNLKIQPYKPKNNSHENIKISKVESSNNKFKIQNSLKKKNKIEAYSKKNILKDINISKDRISFTNLEIENENSFSYIINGSNKKIIFLQRIIYQQKDNIKLLREQNKNLIEKMKKMHEENQAILQNINFLKSELNSYNNNEDNLNSINILQDKYISTPNLINDSSNDEENNSIKKEIIYCLYDKNNLLSYDFINKEFKLKPIKNKDFENLYNKEINTLFIYNEINNKLYIIVGKNNDQLFIYDLNKDKIQKYSYLKNNHMFGGLLFINQRDSLKNQLICLSGKFNKKVEIYNEDDDSWNDKLIEEMPEERSDSYYLLLNNKIYGFFGYNHVLDIYLNDIVCYDLNNNKWSKIMKNSLNNSKKGIKNHFCYENEKDKLIYIFGGDSNINKIVINLETECIVEMNEIKENNKDKTLLNYNFGYKIKKNYLSLFDQYYNILLINCLTNENEIIKYN